MGYEVKIVELPTGMKLPYVEQGHTAGVPVLLLHGYTASWRSFKRLLPCLPESLHAFALTLRGHGDASRPETGYRPRDFSADIAAFMNALGLKSAVLVGGSSGGVIARRFAIDNPARVRALVFLGSPAVLRGKPRLEEMWESTISRMTDPVDPEFVRSFVESTFDRPVPEEFREAMVRDSMKVPARVWREKLEGLLEDDSFSELGKITAPTLILWGDRDAILPLSDQEALAEAIPSSRFIVHQDAGHTFYWEQPERVASDLTDFIESAVG